MGCLEEVLGVIARYRETGRSVVALHPVERSVQRDEPTAPSNIPKMAVTTPGVEAEKCQLCGKMMARPEKYGPEHYRVCGRWTAPKHEPSHEPAF